MPTVEFHSLPGSLKRPETAELHERRIIWSVSLSEKTAFFYEHEWPTWTVSMSRLWDSLWNKTSLHWSCHANVHVTIHWNFKRKVDTSVQPMLEYHWRKVVPILSRENIHSGNCLPRRLQHLKNSTCYIWHSRHKSHRDWQGKLPDYRGHLMLHCLFNNN